MSRWLLFLGTLVFGVVAWSGVASAQERCPFSVSGAITSADATQKGRLASGTASACAAPKPVPNVQAKTQDLHVDSYTFRNRSTAAACVTISLSTVAPGFPLNSSAYLGSFDPANVQSNYLGNSGAVFGGQTKTYGVNVPALADFVVTVNELVPVGAAYNLTVGNCGSIVATAINPNAGPTTGGTPVTISGSGFIAGATVTIGGAPATGVSVAGDGTITATSPPGAAGPADVVVTNPDGQSSTLASAFAYVAPAATTLTLTSSANPSIVGQNVTFTATATSTGGTVTGSITFKDGAADLGMGTLDAAGVATFSTTDLTVGTHPITAVYAGNGTFAPATSAVVSQAVTTGKTATTLTANPTTSVVGNTISFAASVTAVAPATGTPTGSITISSDGAAISGPLALDATGKVTFASSALPVGTHSVVATYSGDAKLGPSASAPLTVRVDANVNDGGASSSGGASSGGASSSGASGGTDAGASSSGNASNAEPEVSEGGGCDCNTTGERTSLGSATLWAFAAIVVLARRRKK